MHPDDVYLREVLFEMRQVGNYVRVSAIDPRTNIEITMVGDPSVGDAILKQTAMLKLRYVIAKKITEMEERGDGPLYA